MYQNSLHNSTVIGCCFVFHVSCFVNTQVMASSPPKTCRSHIQSYSPVTLKLGSVYNSRQAAPAAPFESLTLKMVKGAGFSATESIVCSHILDTDLNAFPAWLHPPNRPYRYMSGDVPSSMCPHQTISKSSYKCHPCDQHLCRLSRFIMLCVVISMRATCALHLEQMQPLFQSIDVISLWLELFVITGCPGAGTPPGGLLGAFPDWIIHVAEVCMAEIRFGGSEMMLKGLGRVGVCVLATFVRSSLEFAFMSSSIVWLACGCNTSAGCSQPHIRYSHHPTQVQPASYQVQSASHKVQSAYDSGEWSGLQELALELRSTGRAEACSNIATSDNTLHRTQAPTTHPPVCPTSAITK